MKELSVFIDESGDWGEYEKHSPFYIVTMVIHEQDKSIENELKHLNERLMYNDCEEQCIHAGPRVKKRESHFVKI